MGGYIDGIFRWTTISRVVTYSSTSSGLAAVTLQTYPHMFSIACDSSICWEYWNGQQWGNQPFTSMEWGSTSSGLAAETRSDTYMDVFWIEGDGSVRSRPYRLSSPSGWGSPYQIADPGSAWGNSIVAVSRDTDKIDVWWIGPTQSNQRAVYPYAQYGYVYTNSFADGMWKGKVQLNAIASIRSGLAVVVRSPTGMEMYNIAYNGSVYGLPWNASNGWGRPYEVVGPNSASNSSGLAALMRDSNNIDILWIGQDRSIGGANLAYDQGRYTWTPFDVLTTEDPYFRDYAASTGLPSDGRI